MTAYTDEQCLLFERNDAGSLGIEASIILARLGATAKPLSETRTRAQASALRVVKEKYPEVIDLLVDKGISEFALVFANQCDAIKFRLRH